jgi:hypothetical protein
MLLAALRGKVPEVVRDHEDSLTSTVFGHLRYVPPSLFWGSLIARARGLPSSDGREENLAHRLDRDGASLGRYESLAVHAWPFHSTWGEPDLILAFSGPGLMPLAVLVEAKLWAEKSGTGERDQLVRYLRLLDDLPALGVPHAALRYLVYLTPRDSLAEVTESAALMTDAADAGRLFRLQWQDVLDVSRQAARTAPWPQKVVLDDVARFLARMGLEYFDGFRRVVGLTLLPPSAGRFYGPIDEPAPVVGAVVARPSARRPRVADPRAMPFSGFGRVDGLDWVDTHRAGWLR